MVLAIPFFVRGIYLIVKQTTGLDDIMIKSLQDDTFLAPFIMFVYITITDLVPITTQLVSMFVVVDAKDLKLDMIYSQYNEESVSISTIYKMAPKVSQASQGTQRSSSQASMKYDVHSTVLINNSKEAGFSFLGAVDKKNTHSVGDDYESDDNF